MKLFFKSKSELPPAVIQAVGLILMLIAAVDWLISGNFNATLFGGGGSLVGLSELAVAGQSLHKIQDRMEKYVIEEEEHHRGSGKRSGGSKTDGT